MNSRTRPILLAAAAALSAVLVVGGCDLTSDGLTEQERIAAFFEDTNATLRDPVVMSEHFSDQVSERSSMNSEVYWEDSFFRQGDGPFAITGIAETTDFTGLPTDVTSAFSGSVTNGFAGPYAITIGFVNEGIIAGNWLIRAIVIPDVLEDIRSIR